MMKIRFLPDGMHFDQDGRRYCALYSYTAPDGRTFLAYAEDSDEETDLLCALMTKEDDAVVLEPLREEQDWALCFALHDRVLEAIGNDPDGSSDHVIDEAVSSFVPPETIKLTEERRAVIQALIHREGRTPEQWLLDAIFGNSAEEDSPSDT